jgi:hypothetical protein
MTKLGEIFNGDKAKLDETAERYPYFTLPLLLKVKNGDDQALQRLSIMSPDRRDLAIVTGSTPASFASFYPQEQVAETPDVDTAIDRFLANYAHGDNQRELDALSSAIFNPTPDYADILAAQQESAGEAQSREDALIDSFIEHTRQREHEALSTPAVDYHVSEAEVALAANDTIDRSTVSDASMLSESLAKMYIARGKYSKALEIIESINLNFPEKSIYFADQIRFLRKLVLNETVKNKL